MNKPTQLLGMSGAHLCTISPQKSMTLTPAAKLLNALRQPRSNRQRFQSWQIRQLQLVTIGGLSGLQGHATGTMGQPWLQILYHPTQNWCCCRIGRMERGQFRALQTRRYVPLHQLNQTCHHLLMGKHCSSEEVPS